jgi:hypothetical protein
MLDSRSLVYVPRPVRVAALLMLTAVLVSALLVVLYYVRLDDPASPKFADWILVGMSIVHLSLSGLAVAVVLFYSAREEGSDVLRARTEQFLSMHMPAALERVSPHYILRQRGCNVERLGRSDIFGAAFKLERDAWQMRLWVGLNVHRIIVIYWVDVPSGEDGDAYTSKMKQVFRFTFSGADKVGFHLNFQPAASVADKTILSIWATAETQHNLLSQPAERLFWAQDIAMMTESFWRTALREGVAISTQDPGPL